jgi:hypothetical protein
MSKIKDILKNDVQAYLTHNLKELALEILACSKRLSQRDKMFIENGSNVRICDPSRGRTSFKPSFSINMRPL